MKIVLLGQMAAAGADILARELKGEHELLSIDQAPHAADRDASLAEADVIVGGPITAVIAQRARKLRLFHAARAGLDGMGLEWLPPHVAVANTYHHETSIAEYVLSAMLLHCWRLPSYDRRLREGNWQGSCIWGEQPICEVLYGRTILLLGLGHIGKEVAKRVHSFGTKVLALSRSPHIQSNEVDLKIGYDTWQDRLSEADFVVVSCPLTQRTRGLLGAGEIARLKPSAYLINVARAEIIDETALYEALRNRKIAGAALDVWYRYPETQKAVCYPSRYPFQDLPNVLMTPHISGWTAQTVEGRMKDIAANIKRLASGQPLCNVIDRSAVP